MADLAKVGDAVSCPVCGTTSIANGSPDTFLDHQPVALVGISHTACPCQSVIVSGLAWFHVNGHPAAIQGSRTANGGIVEASSTARTGAPPGEASPRLAASNDPDRVTYAGQQFAYQADPLQPHLQGGLVNIAAPSSACVFAKSCTVPTGSTLAGSALESV